jgi:S1/P1 Nuclease
VRQTPPDDNLHDYWDNLLGTEQGIEPAIKAGRTLINIQKQTGWVDEVDIQKWLTESVEVAKNSVYTPAVLSEDNSGKALELDAAYLKAAIQVAVNQAVLAGNRLASLLNNKLK